VERQEARAAELFEKAADQGVAWAQTNLGWCYEQGTVVKKDEVKAVELYNQAVEQGNAAAHGYLGRCYKLGRGVGKSEAKAVELWKKAVELLRKDANTGDAWAHGYLGELYAEGLGVEQNLAEAFRFFEYATKIYPEVLQWQLFLAWLLWHGRGTEQDRPRAEGLCAQVRGTERYAERLTNDYIAAGEIWPQVLKWFQEITVAPEATQAIETIVDHPRLELEGAKES
jgi:TPR repeat protein